MVECDVVVNGGRACESCSEMYVKRGVVSVEACEFSQECFEENLGLSATESPKRDC